MDEFVPRFYTMNPETDVLVVDGRGLEEGMKVLIENPHYRAVIKEEMADWELDRALERNRWCTISRIKIKGNLLRFVASYEDGTQKVRTEDVDGAWIAKKDSIAASLGTTTERYMNVYSVINEAFIKHDEYCCTTCNGGSDAPSNKSLVENATRQILGLL